MRLCQLLGVATTIQLFGIPAVPQEVLGIMQPAPFWDALAHSTHGLSLSPPERGGERVLQNAASALPSLRLCRACVRVCVCVWCARLGVK
jgi:hypothetical protein